MEIKHFEDFRGVTASFGIARYEHGITTLELLEYADHALYESKKYKGSITIYQASGGELKTVIPEYKLFSFYFLFTYVILDSIENESEKQTFHCT